ncbi:Tigger transposable element-derived protein 6 [Phytophthora megakarya]|uniref:Tigger transposable element-derived protein 6 n=1 Tax=Phytophthora megakarya TaxID=4795 RepID=A0A225UT86_9STRA|nr:Tigger transposable element-derived protein 6 [Phytophthora megakarya]
MDHPDLPSILIVIFPELDEALANWILCCQTRGIMLDGNIVKAKGTRMLDKMRVVGDDRVALSNGWLQAFQRRHGFRSFKAHGECGSVSEQAIPALLETIRGDGEVKNYALANVYNFDETEVSLYWRSTWLLYRNNKKAWMTGALFRDWLHEFNVDMKKEKWKLLLLIDNASSHSITGMSPSNVKVYFLPPNTTSKLQPHDPGIIGALKRRYRRRQLQHALDKEEEGIDRDIYAVDQLLAMKWVKSCWRDIPKDLVLNCFRHTGIVLGRSSSRRSHKEVDSILRRELLSSLERLRVRDPMSVDDLFAIQQRMTQRAKH